MTTREFISILEKRGLRPHREGRDHRAFCPAHRDAEGRPSLTICDGDDGRTLVKCWSGCKTESIVAALGLTMQDLFNGVGKRSSSMPKRSSRRTYGTLEEAGRAIATRLKGHFSQHWTYRDDDGDESFAVLRFDACVTLDGKKTYRPIHSNGRGHVEGDPPGLLPLYGLPELLQDTSSQIFICEGEKACDAARSIGLLATCSAHGAKSAQKTNWQPLAGRTVAILPDNDPNGHGYAEEVADILSRLDPLAEVRVVTLPGLPEHGDVHDWLEEHDSLEPDALKAQVLEFADEAKPLVPASESPRAVSSAAHLGGQDAILNKDTPRSIPQYIPFPVGVLPKPLAGFVAGAARAIGCDPSYIALPLLAALASAIGNTRRIELKLGWTEPAILWAAIVGDSGTLKSPALEVALRPVRTRQHAAIRRYEEANARYEIERERYEKEHAIWKRSKNEDGDPPPKPEEPRIDRCWCDDTTIEALAVLLLQNPRGLLLVRDELAGWLGSFDRYSQGKGDAAKWLEVHGGRSIMVDRKTGPSKVTYVHRAAVSVTGGIQPATLSRALGAEHRENGLAARLLLACPPRQAKRWTEADISPDMEQQIERIFDKLYSLDLVVQNGGEPEPLDLPLTPAGKEAWVSFYNEHAEEQAELTGDLAAAWSKLEGYAARFALVVHLVRWAAGDKTLDNPNIVDERSVEVGVKLSRWFGREARRVYQILGETDEQRDQRRLVEMMRSRGGSITARELQRSSRMFANAKAANDALDKLVEAGHGRWDGQASGRAGGRPTRRFVLGETADVDDTPDSNAEGGVLSTSTVSSTGDDDRGAIK